MNNKRMENSIRSLTNLYTVVVGAALSVAVVGAIDVNKGLNSVSAVSMLLFIAFFATLLPFFHGAMRHLDDVYIENKNPHVSRSALILDFSLLFLHALVFLILSQLLKNPADFAWILISILLIDVVWGLFTTFGASSSGDFSAESRWTVINFIFVACVASYLIHNGIYLKFEKDPIPVAILLAIACVVRSTVDYVWCKDFYFPK